LLILAVVIIAALVGIDQLIKLWAVQTLKPVGEMEFLRIGNVDILHLTYLENTGSAFGSFAGQRLLLLIVTLLGVAVCTYLLVRRSRNQPLLYWSLLLIIGGALGNMADRIFRGGAVVDYLDIQLFRFAIFNFADSCVTVGTALLFVYILFFMDRKPKQVPSSGEQEPTDDKA
jgi:signal peptidase II